MKVFRNVHMAIAPSPERNDPPLEHFESLALGAQIYHRNIMDRYPIIPIYLARRLAQANRDRAERLRNEKGEPKESFNDDATQPRWNGSSASNVLGESPHHLMMTPEKHQDPTRFPADSRNQSTDIQYSLYNRTHEVASNDTEELHYFISTPLNAPGPFSIMPQMEAEIPTPGVFELSRNPPSRDFSRNSWIDRSQSPRPASPYWGSSCIDTPLDERPISDISQEYYRILDIDKKRLCRDFWSGGSQTSRPASAHSRSSSMNSSLHGRPVFDPQEQNPTFLGTYSAPAVCNAPSSRALPPPPVELGKIKTFNCDICGQSIQVKRRLEWQ